MSDKNYSNCNSCCGGCGSDSSDSVCIHTRKIYDSCRDKECIENLRVYLTEASQSVVDRSVGVKCRNTEIIWVYSDVEPVPFNKGYYSVDLKFFFKVTFDVFTGANRPTVVEGIATYDKKVILFGSEGGSKTYMSKYKFDENDVQLWPKNNLPVAHTEVSDNTGIFLLKIYILVVCFTWLLCEKSIK